MRLNLKRYIIPFILGILGIIIFIVSVLGFTVLRPADTVTAIGQTKAQGNAVYTKAGVLSIYADPVTFSAQSKDNSELVLVVGKSYDISAYATILKATEIKGLRTWKELDLSDISQAKQEGTPEPEGIETSDLWDKTITGKGQVSLTIPSQTQGLSVLVVSLGGDQALTVSLDWQHKRAQYWPWVLLGLGVFLLLGAGLYAWILSRKSISEGETARLDEVSDESVTIDSTETSETTVGEDDVPSKSVGLSRSDEDLSEDETPAKYEEEVNESSESSEDSKSDQDSVDDELDSLADSDDDQSSLESGKQELSSESGRIISIHTATGEIRLPSRGALRTAREKGQDSMELDGVSYATGAIPLVDLTLEDDAPVDQIEVSEVLPEEVENMIQDAANAGKGTGVRPGESLWDRLQRYRSSKPQENQAKMENNNDGEDDNRNV